MKNNWQLFTSITIAIIVILLLSSCGTRKVQNSKTNIKVDSISIDNKRILEQNSMFNEILSIDPIDNSKPIIINGKSYLNAKISYTKNKALTLKIKEEFKSITLKKQKKETIKQTEKTDNTFLYIGLFLVLVLGILAWFKLPSFRKGI
jgi:hypothetical protein